MKKILRIMMLASSIFFMTLPGYAADTSAEIDSIKTEVDVTRNQSNNNNSRIQALEAVTQDLQNQINTIELIPGPQGPEGSQGPQGEQGPAGVNVAAGQQCAQGEFVSGFDQDGNIICSSSSAPVTYAIGDTGPAGGIVFYVYAGGLHGLEAAPADQSMDALWGCYGTVIAGADGTAVGTGAQNTADILAGCPGSGEAAEIADDYTLNGYDDWFLPSKDELNLLYQQKDVVGGFAVDLYWSSTESNSGLAWAQFFLNGNQYDYDKDSTERVRAVRAF
jgi:hypothetical protein